VNWILLTVVFYTRILATSVSSSEMFLQSRFKRAHL